ncbi:MAG: type III ribulose-bisphosphate carboxylase [Candidatus Micrarchaeota archaeon]|nr:type III ribulose-bisphosphate carboxylase [Candidatus Micrarchaeota archaeon]
MAYEAYVNTKYVPSKDDLICRFYVEPKYGVPFERAAGAVAAESSVGTWTDVTTEKQYVKKYAANVFHLDPHTGYVDIAYPLDTFEKKNIPQMLSSIAGNIFGMKEVTNLRLYDIKIPKKMMKWYDGPLFGIPGVRKLLKVKTRPLLGTIVKPKMGLNVKDHAKVAYEAWTGGCDIVKDDENLASQKFNNFEKRFLQTIKMRDKAEKETGEKKIYMVNITAQGKEMEKRAKFVADNGGEYIMVDIITVGWAALQDLRDLNNKLKIVLHEHRAGHAAFTRNPKHGISMLTIAKLSRMIGFDQLHVGTIVGKMEGKAEEVQDIASALSNKVTQPNANTKTLGQDWYGVKPVFPVASGGLHPLMFPAVVGYLGKDVILQAGGGIHGHPKGTHHGAKVARAVINALDEGIKLEDSNDPLVKDALETWGKHKF